jgi:hypothetical protein
MHGKHYDDVRTPTGETPDVHGGLTYSDAAAGEISHPGRPELWWVGFDCAHCYDIVPGHRTLMNSVYSKWLEPRSEIPKRQYRDLAFVKLEVESLAGQLEPA